MNIDAKLTGTPIRAVRMTADERHLMNFAAAVSDANPAYLDDDREGGILSHPIYCVALTWPVCERIGENLECDRFPSEILKTQVHYSEHLELYRLIRPGDRLTLAGEIAAILPHRAGAHLVLELNATDEAGLPVFREHIGGILRG